MNIRVAMLFAVAGLAGGCAQEAAEEAGAEPAAEVSADEAALERLRADYVTHYNMHHADMTAALFADSAIFLAADGSILEGRAAIQAAFETQFAGSPTVDITTGETMVAGDHAVARGSYSVTTTPEGGAPMTLTGSYMTVFDRVGGEWKIGAVLSNYDAPPPEGLPLGEMTGEAPPENGTMKEMVASFAEHYNLGHADMVAALYTEDAVAAYSNGPPRQGRAAIQARMAERLATGSPKIEIHDVGTTDFGGGWAVDGGWYRLTATAETGPIVQEGTYMHLLRQEADGSWKIHWAVTNGQPKPAK